MLCPSVACSAAAHVPRSCRHTAHLPRHACGTAPARRHRHAGTGSPAAAAMLFGGEVPRTLQLCTPSAAYTASTQVSECAQRQLGEDVIDMAAGQPGPSLLPLSQIAAAAAHRFARAGADPFILRYGPEQGYASFRASLAEFLTDFTGHEVQPDDLLITAGVSHGLDLACRHLQSSPLAGVSIFVQVPTYFLAGAIMRQAGLQLVPVPSGPRSLDVGSLQQLLEQPGGPRPSLLYNLVPCRPSLLYNLVLATQLG